MKKLVSLILVAITLFSLVSAFSFNVSAATSWPSLSSSSYCEFIAPKQINVYRYSSLSTRGTSSPAKSYNAYIDKNDVCRIYKITSSYIYIAYPTSSGYKYGYIRRSDLFGLYSPARKCTSLSKVTTYKTASTSSSYGYIASGDEVYNVGTSGNYTYVIYSARSGNRAYKLGYIKTSDYNNGVNKAVVVNNKNTYTNTTSSGSAWEFPMKNAYCTWTSYSNMSWATYDNRSGDRDYHLGIDIYGTNGYVYAASSGTVAACSSSNSGANGRYVIIKHNVNGKTVYSFYAHLSKVYVSKGQSVNTSTRIGIAGGSGYGRDGFYGTHLHFAIVDTLWSNGDYYGYAPRFSGNKTTYKNLTFYNPVYVVKNDRLP